MTWAYARVSSKEQNEARQIEAFHANGIEDAQIVVDKESGKDFNRRGWRRLRRQLRRGDMLIVQSLDRFGRDYEGIKTEWAWLTKKRGVDIKVLDMPILDTTQGQGLVGKFISDLVLQVLGFVAEEERKHIKERQAQGIAAAHARGVKFGRSSVTLPENFEDVCVKYREGSSSLRRCARLTGISHITFAKYYKMWLNKAVA